MAKRTTRVYWRLRSYGMAAYADFRDYADVGAGQQALIAEGEDRPTSNPESRLAWSLSGWKNWRTPAIAS